MKITYYYSAIATHLADSSYIRRLPTWPCGLMDKASDFESEDCGFDPRQGLAGYFFPSVPGRKWLENIFKIITTGGVRTHAGILPLDLKSNALTTRPPWCCRIGKADGTHSFHHQQTRVSWSFRISWTILLRRTYQHKNQANKQRNRQTGRAMNK